MTGTRLTGIRLTRIRFTKIPGRFLQLGAGIVLLVAALMAGGESTGAGALQTVMQDDVPKSKPLRVAGMYGLPATLPQPKPLIPGVTLPPPPPPALPGMTARSVKIKRGDTLMEVLVREGASRQEAAQALSALRDVFDPRSLRADQEIKVLRAPRRPGAKPRVVGLTIAVDGVTEVGAQAQGNAYVGFRQSVPLTRHMAAVTGEISISLYQATQQADLPYVVFAKMTTLFSHDVDFQRDLQPGDRFQVMYEVYKNPQGDTVRTGQILYTGMRLSGTDVQLYAYRDQFGDEDYYDREGQSYRRALMRTPIDGARLSSGYGKRRHPILGYTKMHQGVDFAAPIGTPVLAAGNGTIERLGRYSSYGNYIRIRHADGYSTAYAHLNGYKRGLRAGSRVKQGDVIGYLGNTGRSTGPHLHYEILKNGRHVNPMKVKMPSGKRLEGSELDRFLRRAGTLDQQIATMTGEPSLTELASR